MAAPPAKPPAAAAKPAKKKLFPKLAVIYADNCTGCEACIEVCPVDCIYKVPGEDMPSVQSFCDIDLDRCIGCSLGERWCPWMPSKCYPRRRSPMPSRLRAGRRNT